MNGRTLAYSPTARTAVIALSAALCLGITFGLQASSAAQKTTTTTVTTTTVQHDWDYPTSPYLGRVTALQTFRSIDLSRDDIARILPLMVALRDAQRTMWADTANLEGDLVVLANSRSPKVETATAIDQGWQRYRDRRDKIWVKVTDRIGASKAAGLRNLVEPEKHEIDSTQVSERIHRIDTLLAQWDAETRQRLAANKADTTTTVVATTETNRFPDTTVAVTPEVYYTSAPISCDDLVDLLHIRFAHMVAPPHGDQVFFNFNHDMMMRDYFDLWNRKMQTWD